MPLSLVWTIAPHVAQSPPIFVALWSVAGTAWIFTAAVATVRIARLYAWGREAADLEGLIFLQPQAWLAMHIVSTPMLYGFCSLASLFFLRASLAFRLLESALLGITVNLYFGMLFELLGEQRRVGELIAAVPPQRWWCSPPLCCLGFCCSPTAGPLKGRHFRHAFFIIRSYAVEAQMMALWQLLTSVMHRRAIQRLDDGFCFDTVDEGIDCMATAMRVVHAVWSMSCMTSLNVTRRGVKAVLDNAEGLEDGIAGSKALHLQSKHFSVTLMVLLTGLLRLLSGAIAPCFLSPVLRPEDTDIPSAVGCPVYDKEVMATALNATLMAVFMAPMAYLSARSYRLDDAWTTRLLHAAPAGGTPSRSSGGAGDRSAAESALELHGSVAFMDPRLVG